MSENEHKIADTRGEYAQVRRDGETLPDAGWVEGRLVLSNKRLVLAGGGDKRTVPLGRVIDVGDGEEFTEAAPEGPDRVGIRLEGGDVFLLAPDDPAFESSFYRAVLDGGVVLALHPAGGDGDTAWQKARLGVEDGSPSLELADGTSVKIAQEGIDAVDADTRTIRDQERPVLDVRHGTGGQDVRTAISGKRRHVSILESLLGGPPQRPGTGRDRGEEDDRRESADLDVSDADREVLMALYSGVSPFEIPEFLDMDVDEVEGIYERLVEHDVLEEVRKRREVTLKARGRNIASDAIGDG